MRLVSFLCASVLLGSPALCAGSSTSPDAADLTATFSVSSPTKVPGKTLKPGTYAIKVVDHLSDRIILEVDGPKGKAESKFIALENSAIRGSSNSGPITYGVAHGDIALRGFTFPGGSTAEFVYPKEEAVAIAKASTNRVPAIDPASEGIVATKHLSQQDMQLVTLWTLSSTRVGPENATQSAIQAERYQPPVAAPVQYARTQAPTVATPAQQTPMQVASATAPPSKPRAPRVRPQVALTALPHTASEMPLIALCGCLLLFAALLLRTVRVSLRER